MKHLCYSKFLIVLVFILCFISNNYAKSFAIYYGTEIKDILFSKYDDVILDPNHINMTEYEKAYFNIHSQIFGYISLTEVSKDSKYFPLIKKQWIIGENKDWNSVICDINNEEYVNFLFDVVIKDVRNNGYYNYFFDTIDSFYKLDKKYRKKYIDGEIAFFKKLKQKYTNAKIILNRGFEIESAVKPYAFLVEGMFYGYSPERSYGEISKSDRKWLIAQLKKIKTKNIYIVDYVCHLNIEKVKKIKNSIEKMGFSSFITDEELRNVGCGGLSDVKRNILIVYDKSVSANDEIYSNVHRMGVLPLEYLGYKCVLKDVNELKSINVTDYRGVIFWLEKNIYNNYNQLYKIAKDAKINKIKIFFLNYFGFPLTRRYLSFFGLTSIENKSDQYDKIKILYKNKNLDFEGIYVAPYNTNLIFGDSIKPYVLEENSKHQRYSSIAFTNWGGYSRAYSILQNHPTDVWTINPFLFFLELFPLNNTPMPDVTTENGNRIFFTHLDGDGFMEKANFGKHKYSSEVLYKKIFKKIKIPFSISIIEGEIGPKGLYKKISYKLEKIAKKIFKLPNVEPASHSYSHPFAWKKSARDKMHEGKNLPIKNYKFSVKREILGSIDYINKNLLSSTNKTHLFFWTGNCVPSKNALKICYDNNLLNLNGGDNAIKNTTPYYTGITPIGIKRGIYYQIYAPMENENIYTNLWTGPYYGFKDVIETIKLTNYPYRVKPIDVYYHFYSGSKLASLNAVKFVYKYCLKQDIIPIYASDYIRRAIDFYQTTIFNLDTNRYLIRTAGNIKTLKILGLGMYPDLKRSKGIVGFRNINSNRYFSLSNGNEFVLQLQKTITRDSYLRTSNGIIKGYRDYGNYKRLIIKSYVPLKLSLVNIKKIKIVPNQIKIKKEIKDTVWLELKKAGKYSVTYWCK